MIVTETIRSNGYSETFTSSWCYTLVQQSANDVILQSIATKKKKKEVFRQWDTAREVIAITNCLLEETQDDGNKLGYVIPFFQ